MVTGNKSKRDLIQFLQSLDVKSRAILSYLWWHRHAGIEELRNIVDTLDDCEVLYRLKEIINGRAVDNWGRPLVSFEQAKVDRLTGEKILFNWWYLDEEDELIEGAGNTVAEVFNEKDSIVIIAQLPDSINLYAPDIQFRNGILRIRFKKTD
ncbi:MAG: hypothetical protein JXA46_16265 [Dehalococcoidales bacterium]|nr:hypothetical protein [Dehalococcoidales bacterium]